MASSRYGAPWWPGADLVGALEIVGRGRLPGPVEARAVLGALGLSALGLALALPGVSSWRFGR